MPRSHLSVLVAGAAIAASAGCAARPTTPPAAVPDVAQARALVEEGCHACLREAAAIYAVADGPHALDITIRGVFETSLLLSLRESELGLDADAHLEHARNAAARLADPVALAHVEAAALYEPSALGRAPETLERRRLPFPELRKARAAQTARLAPLVADDIVAAYLYVAIACQDLALREELATETLRPTLPPLLAFRVAICPGRSEPLDPWLANGARWPEAGFFEGRRLMANPADLQVARAVPLLRRAAEAFPRSPAILVTLANAQRTLGRLTEAVNLYQAVLDLEPDSRDARLGLLIALSYLARSGEAIDAASTLIALGTWHIGDAHYWRAWNQLRLRALDDAEADIARALTLLSHTQAYALGGQIALERRELLLARTRLVRAREIDRGNCQAAWLLGLVEVEAREWEPAAQAFAAGTTCYAGEAAREARDAAAAEAQASWPEDVRAARVAGHRRAHAEAALQEARSAFNAAQAFLQLGRSGDARAVLPPALAHPDMREKAEALAAKLPR